MNTAVGERTLFDLVVLDLNMPISNGYETCKKIIDLYSKKKLLSIKDESHEQQ